VGGMSRTESLPVSSTKPSLPFHLWVEECEMVGVTATLSDGLRKYFPTQLRFRLNRGCLLKMQTPRFYPRPAESELQGGAGTL